MYTYIRRLDIMRIHLFVELYSYLYVYKYIYIYICMAASHQCPSQGRSPGEAPLFPRECHLHLQERTIKIVFAWLQWCVANAIVFLKMLLYIHICIYIYIYTYIYTYIYIYICVCICIETERKTGGCTHGTFSCIYKIKNKNIYIHTNKHTLVQAAPPDRVLSLSRWGHWQ